MIGGKVLSERCMSSFTYCIDIFPLKVPKKEKVHIQITYGLCQILEIQTVLQCTSDLDTEQPSSFHNIIECLARWKRLQQFILICQCVTGS